MAVLEIDKLQPLHKDVLVYDMYFGEQTTKSGIIILDDDETDRGIHPRWAKVYSVGPEDRSGLTEADWVLIEHGRWSRGIELNNGIVVRRFDPKSILLKTDVDPEPEIGSFVGPIGAK